MAKGLDQGTAGPTEKRHTLCNTFRFPLAEQK